MNMGYEVKGKEMIIGDQTIWQGAKAGWQ